MIISRSFALSFSVVRAQSGELFVEVQDDRWTGPSKKWLLDDHLELWLATGLSGSQKECSDPKAPGAKQWGVRVADGAVFPAFGDPTEKLEVERVDVQRGKAKAVRFKLKLPPSFDAVSVVYSDSDDGKSQKRLIGTSKLKLGVADTLGTWWVVKPEQAVCEVKEKALVPRQTRTFSRNKAVIDAE